MPFESPEPKETQPSRLAERWGQELARHGFTPVSNYFLANYAQMNPAISYAEAMFIIHLMVHKWAKDAPYPSYGRIASAMGVSPKSARRFGKSLEEKGYLTREAKSGTTNRFNLAPLTDTLAKRAGGLNAKKTFF